MAMVYPPIRTVVALLAEGVDRNTLIFHGVDAQQVALLAEGVDRNSAWDPGYHGPDMSPSSRRAWIEICKGG